MRRRSLFLLIFLTGLLAFGAFWFLRPYDIDFNEFRAAVPHSEYSRFASIDGIPVHYQEKGNGPALVLIHGYGSSTYTWKDVFDQLAGQYRVIAVDLKGFGFSGKPDGDYGLAAQAALLKRLLDHLQIDSAIFCGNSMGGSIAMMCAIDHPQKVSGLILVDSSAFNENRGSSISPQVLQWPVIGSIITAVALTSDSLVEQGLQKSFYDQSKVTADRVATYYRPLRTRSGQSAARLARSQRDNSLIEKSLHKIDQPTLIIWGEEDRIIPVELGRRLNSSIANSKLVVFEQCGHLPQEEMPERLTKEIIAFMNSHLKAQK